MEKTGRLFLVDILRGLASLSVVIWHYQHFFFNPGQYSLPTDFHPRQQPFYDGLWVLYDHGWSAVYLFFVLSGFVFFFHYAAAVRDRTVGAKEFFILRFSRLYPLHFVTLIFVALGQAIAWKMNGSSIVYQCNDLSRFAINLLLAVHWLPAKDICWSFNAPIWSVSVEVFLYMLFFLFALRFPQRWGSQVLVTSLMVGFGTTVFLLGGYHLLGEPVLCFFSGGLAYLIWVRSDWPREYVALASTAALAASGIYLSHNWQWHSHFVLGVGLVLYPALVLLLATLQRWNAELGRNTRVIGDITYSTYLLHFPLQLMLILLVQSEILQIDFADEAAWVSFLALVIALGIPTYYRFERPAQNALRKLLLRGFRPQLSEPVKTSSPS